MNWSRRRLLMSGGAFAGMTAAGLGSAAGLITSARTQVVPGQDSGVRRIALANLHTSERVEVEYVRDGRYVADALGKIETLLRDFRNDQRHAIDPTLMDYLVELAGKLNVEPSFSVISGYRSPQTNAQLHERSSGVAQHSLHIEGRAIDVRMAHVDCATLASDALALQRGGVGYYRASNFVHLDTGAFRTWRG